MWIRGGFVRDVINAKVPCGLEDEESKGNIRHPVNFESSSPEIKKTHRDSKIQELCRGVPLVRGHVPEEEREMKVRKKKERK